MASNMENGDGRGATLLRIAAWGAAALLVVLPLIAMQFTDEVNWTVSDFMFAGTMIFGTGLIFELIVRTTGNMIYRAAAGVALAAAFLIIWLTGAVGIIGSEANSLNLMYGGLLLVALAGSLLARFRAPGMARAMGATALAQVVVVAIALVVGFGTSWWDVLRSVVLNAGFVGMWLVSAWLFGKAAA